MKRIFSIITALALLFIFTACSNAKTVRFVPQAESYDSDVVFDGAIGISLSDENSEFQKAFLSACEVYASQKDYEVFSEYAVGQAQADSVMEMLENGIASMIILPSDPDVFQNAAEQCSAAGVPIIDVLNPMNAVYETLICPDYTLIGTKGARLCREAKKDLELSSLDIFLLEGASNSFTMQLIHDGFTAELNDDSLICGTEHFAEGEEIELEGSGIESATVIFCQSEELAAAAHEANPSAAIICVGASVNTLELISDKTYYASVFYGADQLAKYSVSRAVLLIGSSVIPDTYVELSIGVASESTVAKYISLSENGYPTPEQ